MTPAEFPVEDRIKGNCPTDEDFYYLIGNYAINKDEDGDIGLYKHLRTDELERITYGR